MGYRIYWGLYPIVLSSRSPLGGKLLGCVESVGTRRRARIFEKIGMDCVLFECTVDTLRILLELSRRILDSIAPFTEIYSHLSSSG